MQLALGTLALEETDQAITAEQAAALLPLWKAANSLSGADNVAAEEMTGLFKQIEEAMTSRAGASHPGDGSLRAEHGRPGGQVRLPDGRRRAAGNLTEEMRATMEAAAPSGQMPEGFTPGWRRRKGWWFSCRSSEADPGRQGGGQGFFMQRGDNGGSSGQSAAPDTGNPIYQAVIELLEKKIQ